MRPSVDCGVVWLQTTGIKPQYSLFAMCHLLKCKHSYFRYLYGISKNEFCHSAALCVDLNDVSKVIVLDFSLSKIRRFAFYLGSTLITVAQYCQKTHL